MRKKCNIVQKELFFRNTQRVITSIWWEKIASCAHYLAPSGGHPMGSGRSKLSTILNVLGTILSTYNVPSRWSHSCCRMRACHPEACTLMGLPFRSKPETSTSRYRSTTALYPSTLASQEDWVWDHTQHSLVQHNVAFVFTVSSYISYQW